MIIKKPVVAIFDFDGTLTKGDTFLPFLNYIFGRWKFLFGLLYTSPFIMLYLLKIISNQHAKRKVINFFFKDKDTKYIRDYAHNFVNEKIDTYLKPNVIKKLKWHQEQGHLTVLISASLDVYVKIWAKKYKFNFIETTELKKIENKFTGEINGNNCYGIEKVKRLNKIFSDGIDNYETYGYGDGIGDKHYLEICNFRYYKNDLLKL